MLFEKKIKKKSRLQANCHETRTRVWNTALTRFRVLFLLNNFSTSLFATGLDARRKKRRQVIRSGVFFSTIKIRRSVFRLDDNGRLFLEKLYPLIDNNCNVHNNLSRMLNPNEKIKPLELGEADFIVKPGLTRAST